MNPRLRNLKLLIVLSLLIIVPLGLFCKFYRGFGQEWVNNYLAAVWYEVFWCLFFFGLIANKKSIILIPIGVFVVTCVLEILQLWHPPLLELIRSYLIGRLLLGTSFSWWDFPHYVVGCLMGWWLLKKIWDVRSRGINIVL